MTTPDPTASVELSNLECAVILTGCSLMLQMGGVAKPPPEVITAIDTIVGKLADACEVLNGPSDELERLKASRHMIQFAQMMRTMHDESGS